MRQGSSPPRSNDFGHSVLLNGLRRLGLMFAGVVVVTVAISLLVGLVVGSGPLRAISVGLYLAGALLLFGCFLIGIRGPLRGVARSGETVPIVAARGVRRASVYERSEATRGSILLFVLGLSLVVLGALVDPNHRAF